MQISLFRLASRQQFTFMDATSSSNLKRRWILKARTRARHRLFNLVCDSWFAVCLFGFFIVSSVWSHVLNASLSHSQLGVALGFLLPPLLVQNHDDLELVGRDFQLMFYLIAGFTTLLVTLVVLCKCLSSVFSSHRRSQPKMKMSLSQKLQ